ncbi:S-layer homology domain-containing protein, partial [Pseudoflavonifractor phocaeensis]|uniref:S-layer homology domain-containing protein n=1 Tax=Pseudoflavonifractor phocaeensis TaxID=1870988 RepID=UPI00210B474F
MKARKPLALILSAAMILSMLSLSAFAAEGETVPALADAESSWAAESINRWAKAGIVQGDSDGNFNPAKPLSRAELATIFVKMFGLTGKADNTYADLKGDEWYADAIL